MTSAFSRTKAIELHLLFKMCTALSRWQDGPLLDRCPLYQWRRPFTLLEWMAVDLLPCIVWMYTIITKIQQFTSIVLALVV